MKKIKSTKLKAIIAAAIVGIATVGIITGCSQADRVSRNLAKEADNFNVVRRLTVINCIEGDTLLQMTGRMSITADMADNQLEVIVENEDGTYCKQIVGLSDNVTYVVEDIESSDVSNYKYTINYNPKMWLPVEVDTID